MPRAVLFPLRLAGFRPVCRIRALAPKPRDSAFSLAGNASTAGGRRVRSSATPAPCGTTAPPRRARARPEPESDGHGQAMRGKALSRQDRRKRYTGATTESGPRSCRGSAAPSETRSRSPTRHRGPRRSAPGRPSCARNQRRSRQPWVRCIDAVPPLDRPPATPNRTAPSDTPIDVCLSGTPNPT